MIKQTLFVPLAGCLLAMACTQAIAAPNPYSNFVVFGDSLNDAGTFTDSGGPAGATQRYTNRTGPVYQDGSGESRSLNSTQLLGGRLGFSADETAASTSAVRANQGLADGNNWAVGGYRTDQILDSITTQSATGSAPGSVICRRTISRLTQMRCTTSREVVTTSFRGASSTPPRRTPPQTAWPTVCKCCRPPARNT